MRTITRRNRTASSILALATALAVGPSPAAAQSFQGTGTPLVSGSATITTPTGSTTNIAVNNPQTVITWTPFDNTGTAPISFQAGGTTATFTGTSNFAVLNRIISNDASRQVQMFGNVNSQICSAACATGGSIYFYTPGGFLIGGGANFNVGSLVLSASPIAFNATTGAFITGPRNEVSFGQALTPGATITTNPTSQINALNSGSYVAFVAPRIIRGGNIAVNGQAAIVAAEAATVRFAPDGLFDIEVTSGTGQANGMTGSGDITGPASSGAGDNHRIYMVAVPKNQALSLAISQGGDLGFDVAGAANVVGNAIVLSAGHDIVNGAIQTARSLGGGTGNTNISAFDFNATSAIVGRATGRIDMGALATAVTYHSLVDLTAFDTVELESSGASASLTIKGEIELSADRAIAAGSSGTAGNATLFASAGGTLVAEKDVTVTADATGASTATAGVAGGSATGGQADVQAQSGGSLTILGNVAVSATGTGGSATVAGANGGNGTGGEIQIGAGFGSNGSLTIAGAVNADVSGYGGNSSCVSCNGLGGSGNGGTIFFGGLGNSTSTGVGNTATFDSFVSLVAEGVGGISSAAAGTGGYGEGGDIFAGNRSSFSAADVTVDGFFSADASGWGGDALGAGGTGGIGQGGEVYLRSTNSAGSFTLVSTSLASANGYGGSADSGDGGDGFGGQSEIEADGAELDTLGGVTLEASGHGGSATGTGNTAGFGYGGSVYAHAHNSGTLAIGGSLTAEASGFGGLDWDSIAASGNGYGGYATLHAGESSTVSVAGLTRVVANGEGGQPGEGFAGGTAGDGFGGDAEVYVTGAGSTLALSSTTVEARGYGSLGWIGVGGEGFGGSAELWAQSGGTATVTGNLIVNADGIGGYDAGGFGGGDGFGGGYAGSGYAFLSIYGTNAGTAITVTGPTDVSADGFGGNSLEVTGGTGGSGTGGRSAIMASIGTIGLAAVSMSAVGEGGDTLSGTGGSGSGGEYAKIDAAGGTITSSNNVIVSAGGAGGNGSVGGAGTGGGNVALGTGGAQLLASGTGQLTISGQATVIAAGTGGAATTSGGAAQGGVAQIFVSGGGDIDVLGKAIVNSDAVATLGAFGIGGLSRISANSGGTVELFELNLRADGRGGTGSATVDAGNGQGGTATLEANGAGSLVRVTQAITTGNMQDREMLSADGFGGDTNGAGDAKGGLGTGGTLNLKALNGGEVLLATGALGASEIYVRIRGYGGLANVEGSTGGDAVGGIINMVVDGGTMTTGQLQLSSYAQGGSYNSLIDGFFNASGGDASGGERNISVLNGGTLTTYIPGGVTGGSGGEARGTGTGGDGSGGTARLTVDDATLNITGNTIIVAQNSGGRAWGTGNGGNATGGGVATVNIINGATVNIASGATLGIGASGFGGQSDGVGGSGTGGNVTTTITGSSVLGGTLDLYAVGQGGYGLTGGGDGTGGSSRLFLNAATINGQSLRVTAAGNGNWAGSGNAGDGIGGTALLQNGGGNSTITLSTGPVEVLGLGAGGDIDGSSGNGGNGTGGTANLFAAAGSLTINAGATVNASGTGGNGLGGGNGGHGTGGTAELGAFGGGALTLNGSLTLLGTGLGGNAPGGIGGDGIGKVAGIFADGGNVAINGFVFIDTSGTGGDGGTGGYGEGGGVNSAIPENVETGAYLFAANGSIAIDGSMTMRADATGGAGASGGNGGDAQGGWSSIAAVNRNAGPSSITISGVESSVDISANATGGAGGTGTSGNAGGNGGRGGDAGAGSVTVLASAGNGAIAIDDLYANANGLGGRGGDGGNGDGEPGGDGGEGGNAWGGAIQIGTQSGAAQATGANNGSATFGYVSATAHATGGRGGDGNFGSVTGNGGNGGDAVNGGTLLLVRGSEVTVDTFEMFANAAGGSGGMGATGGTGGDATIGSDTSFDTVAGIGVEVTSRFQIPAQRGTLNAGMITGESVASAGIGGSGAANGASINEGGHSFNVRDADATIQSLEFYVQADTPGETALHDRVAVVNGTVTVTDVFEFITPGALSIHADSGGLTADTIRVSASDFVYDSVYTTLGTPGTFSADAFDITTAANFVTVANLNSGSGLSIIAPGSIATGNVTAVGNIYFNAYGFASIIDVGDVASDGSVDLYAETILGGDMTAAGYINLFAGGLDTIVVGDLTGAGVYATALGNITTGNIVSSLDVGIESFEGSITTQNITAATTVDLDAAGAISFGNVVAADFNFIAGGGVSGGDILAENHADGEAEGAIVLGDITVTGAPTDGEFSVGLLSATSILVGDVLASSSIGIATTGNLTAGSLTAGNLVMALVGGNIVTGAITTPNSGQVYLADDSMFITGGGGNPETEFDPAIVLALAPVATGGSITIGGPVATGRFRSASATGLSAGAITSASSIEARTGGALNVGAIDAGTFADLQAMGALSATSIEAGTSVNLLSGAVVGIGDVTAGTSIHSRSTGAADFGDLVAGTTIDVGARGALSFDSASAAERIRLGSDIAITGGAVTSGDSIVATAFGDITLGALSAGIVNPSASSGALYEVALVTLGAISTQAIDAAGDVQLAGDGGISTGAVTTGARMFAVSDGPISLGALDIGGTLLIGAFEMFEYTGDIEAVFDARPTFDSAMVAAPGNVTLGAINAGSFALAVGGDLTLGPITVDGFLDLFAGADLTINGNIEAGDSVTLGAVGAVSAGDILAGTTVLINAGGAVDVGNITAGTGGPLLFAAAIGPMDVGSGDPVEIFGESIVTGNIETDGYVGLYAETSIVTGTIDAGHDIIALAGTTASFGAITTPERFILAGYANLPSLYEGESFNPELIFSFEPSATGGNASFLGLVEVGNFAAYVGGDIGAGDIFSETELRLEAGGDIALRDLDAGDDIDLKSDGSVTLRDVTAGTEFDFDVGGSISGRNIVAGVEISGEGAGGDVTFGNLTAGFTPGEAVDEDTFSIGFSAGGNITVGNVRGAQRVGFGADGDLTTGNIESGWDVMLFAGDDVRTGSIVSGQGDNVYIADISMCEAGGGCRGQDTDFDPEIVLALAPVATGGSIIIDGPVTTGSFRAAAGEDLRTVNVTASTIYARAGSLATLNGLWRAGDVTLISGDIAIGTNGGIDAGTDGSILLQAVADGGAVIGDNVTGGGGYKLSNAEFAKISGGDLTITVGGFGGDADTLIGDLTVTGPLAGSNVESSDGGVSFVTLSESGNDVDGTLRIVGDIVATGFGPDNYLAFATQNFELDAATGSISITGSNGALSGILEIAADRIHVADGALLDKLAVNPQFAGYREALNAPAAVQRPDGVIRAGAIEIEFLDVGNTGPHSLLVQNTGTAATPAGFTVTDADIGDDSQADLPAGSVDLVINGQIVTQTGTLTGIAVRDLLVTEFGTLPFTATSTINGCALTGSCGSGPPPAAIVTPTTVTILTADPIGESSFGNEFDIDDSVAGGGDASGDGDGDLSSPIEAPQPLFDNRPLVDEGEIDDPVSGAGNPSLYGVQSDSDDEDDEEDEEDGDGDGKKDRDSKKGSPVGGGQ